MRARPRAVGRLRVFRRASRGTRTRLPLFKLANTRKLVDNARLNAWLDPAVDRFKALRSGDKDEEGIARQEDFRGKLGAFKNLYGFVGQVVNAQDLVAGVTDQLVGDDDLRQAARVNDRGNFAVPFKSALEDALLSGHDKHAAFINKVFEDEGLGAYFRGVMLDRVYMRLTSDDEDTDTIPLRRVPLSQVRPFENCVPALDLKVAAGGFSDVQDEPGNYRWVALPGRTRAAPDLFVAQVLGESMNRRIPSGAWCLWRLRPAGDLNGRIVLAQHRDIADPEHGGSYTVKIFQSAPAAADPDAEPSQVTLHPASTDPTFTPIVLDDLEEGQLTIIAELVEVL